MEPKFKVGQRVVKIYPREEGVIMGIGRENTLYLFNGDDGTGGWTFHTFLDSVCVGGRVIELEALVLDLWGKLGHDYSCCEDKRPTLITEILEKM